MTDTALKSDKHDSVDDCADDELTPGDDVATTTSLGRCARCMQWLRTPAFYIYCNFLLCRWGDRMWSFAVGLYLVHMSNGQLLHAAIFGFTCGTFILLLGSLIGDWVDATPRLRVVRVSLSAQNVSVVLCCVAVCLRLTYTDQQSSTDSAAESRDNAAWIRRLLEAVVIALAVLAQLASVAYKIAIEKDWIVVIAADNKFLLANLNAVTRSLDLLCKVLSPTVAGFIMTYASLLTSAVVIAGWNVISLAAEYTILSHIYHIVPALAVKPAPSNGGGDVKRPQTTVDDDIDDTADVHVDVTSASQHVGSVPPSDDRCLDKSSRSDAGLRSAGQGDAQLDAVDITADAASDSHAVTQRPGGSETGRAASGASRRLDGPPSSGQPRRGARCHRLCQPVSTLVTGWRTYARQSVMRAGISLALLYMTVLGFDSITVGYIYSSGVTEVILGVCMALAGATGIVGTFLFTVSRRRLGLERTGVIAFSVEVSCLTLAVASVFLPGSRFDPGSFSWTRPGGREPVGTAGCNVTPRGEDLAGPVAGNYSTLTGEQSVGNVTSSSATGCDVASPFNISILVLLVGIISSRIGLWMADLVVTQSMQEAVPEAERGVVGGVQNSLNMLMDMVKFALVIALPQIEIFGLHIVLSFAFIFSAGLLFTFHAWRVRGRRWARLACC